MKKNFARRLGLISAFAAVTASASSIAISAFLNKSFNPFNNFLSDLGIGKSAAFFNYGMIATGVLMLVFFACVLSMLGEDRKAMLGSIVGMISALGLFGVGFFPENTGVLHELSAGVFFTAITLSAIILTLAGKKAQESKVIAASCALLTVSAIAFIITEAPILETIVVIFSWVWVLAFAKKNF